MQPVIMKRSTGLHVIRIFVSTVVLLAVAVGCFTPKALPPGERPAHWAQPVSGTNLRNFWQVTPDLYRSHCPDGVRDIGDLRDAGIATVINLRAHTDTDDGILHGGFTTHHYKMMAGSVTQDDLRNALRLFLDSPSPCLFIVGVAPTARDSSSHLFSTTRRL